MRSIGHPDFVYRPQSAEQRARQSASQRARLGIPDGHVRIYGVHVPEVHADTIRPYAAELSRLRGYDAAHSFVARAGERQWLVAMERLTPEKIKKDDPRYVYRPRSPRIIGAIFERIARFSFGIWRKPRSGGRAGAGGRRGFDILLAAEFLGEGASTEEIAGFFGINESYLRTKLRGAGLVRSKRRKRHDRK